MTCASVRTALLEGDHDAWEALEPHLAGCPDCAALKEAILVEEARLDEVLDDFAHGASFDAALRRARDVPPSTPSWRSPLMTVVVLASAAAALFTVIPWGQPSAPIDATVGVEDARSAQPSEPQATPATERVHEPVPAEPEPVVPVPVEPEDAVASPGEAEPPLVDLSACGSPDDLGAAAMEGTLDDEAHTCLTGLLAPDSTADAVPVLRLLAIDAFASGDMEGWERHALQLASVTEDPDLHYKLALYYAKTPETAPMSLHHADVAIGMADRWPEAMRGSRIGNLRKLRAGATLQMYVDEPGPETKAAAAEAARDWSQDEGLSSKQAKTARKACEALATSEWCAEEN